jgi:hypothetical protein
MFRVLLIVALCAMPAMAEPVTFMFGGEVTNVTDTLLPPFQDTQIGDVFELTYTFESTAPDMEADPMTGSYAAITEFTVKLGDAEATYMPTPPFDLISVFVDTNRYGILPGAPPIGVIAVVDFEPGALKDDSLPLSLPWEERTFTSFGFAAGGSAEGTLTSWVPEPATLSLLVLVAPLVFRRR